MSDEVVPQTVGKKKKGLLLGIVLALLAVLIVVGLVYASRTTITPRLSTPGAGQMSAQGADQRPAQSQEMAVAADVRWEATNDGGFQPSSQPPDCPSPLVLDTPTDLSKVVSILYPGQTRGGDYKLHGGFRFADGVNDVVVTAPMDATVVDASRYLVSGEVQYLFDFVNACGIQYRLGHLRTLATPFAALADQLPPAQEMDSRTTQVSSVVKVKKGDTVATAVGLLGSGNAFFDFGVFDLRQENAASKSPAFQAAHTNDRGQTWHAVCWFDLLSPENVAKVRSLPATSPGSQSDYCK